ncbi:MAG: methyltransferase domain-containing protein [Leucobacter sp.]|nr:methyltransferase domain-containing protein [Leucobacter sp.]
MTASQLRCHYFEAGRCRSCSLIETAYDAQLLEKERRCRELLREAHDAVWLPTFTAGDRGFRNRAKLVVGGNAGGPVTLGILGPDGRGVDLRECAIQAPGIASVIAELASFIEVTGLAPYDVPARQGELKFVHVTEAPDGALMLRFVVRSDAGCAVVRSHLSVLQQRVPQASVISVNLLPEHKAVLEGEREVLLVGESLPMQLGLDGWPLTLHLRPQSFFQTNTGVARALYAQVADWVAARSPRSLWDLYCGVGGFALHCAAAIELRRAPAQTQTQAGAAAAGGGGAGDVTGPAAVGGACEVLGVELSEAAVQSAQRSSSEANLQATFIAADATQFALNATRDERPEVLIVNPPRRGLGQQLAQWIESSGIDCVVYSSCNPDSLARDLALMPSYRIDSARVFDMFPHTTHLEVAILLSRNF